MQELTGKVALVTGGGSGIGRGIATTFAAAGAKVAVAGRREAPLQEVKAEIEGLGGGALAIAGDVSRREEAERIAATTVETFGELHIVVNNAGVAFAGPIEETSEERVHALVDIDLKGPIFVSQAALPHLRRHRERGGASIVNVSSSVTQMALKNFSVYSAAKAGVDMLTRCLALELAADRVRVNAICPGVVKTPIFETMMDPAAAATYVEGFDDLVPLGRAGMPEDIAKAALFLAGEAGGWITGAVVPVDGGLGLGPS